MCLLLIVIFETICGLFPSMSVEWTSLFLISTCSAFLTWHRIYPVLYLGWFWDDRSCNKLSASSSIWIPLLFQFSHMVLSSSSGSLRTIPLPAKCRGPFLLYQLLSHHYYYFLLSRSSSLSLSFRLLPFLPFFLFFYSTISLYISTTTHSYFSYILSISFTLLSILSLCSLCRSLSLSL